jgi:phosphoglycolate phosphatase-like HAD superfamily hydrolase
MAPVTPPAGSDAPLILALDFDGVLCEGAREYFESSRRTCARVWPDEPLAPDPLIAPFRELRAVIETGWEMPVLLRAMTGGVPPARIAGDWAATREGLVGRDGRPRAALVETLKRTLDEVRREWIAADRREWLARHDAYLGREELARVVREPAATVIVTTKEGEFAREILAGWGIEVAGIQGKESGSHKCENLRQLRAGHAAAHGGVPPRLWFVEDRLETLRCVTTHPDLEAIELFLATWGYNTAETRAATRQDPRVRPLTLDQFRAGIASWH